MARIKKRGLDYFPLNTDFIQDRLVRRIMKREGDGALAILLGALSCIYAGEGYYVSADELFYEDLSANLYEKDANDVKRILALAVGYGIFDAALFGKYHILTSAEIQSQYIFSTKRRKSSVIDPLYCLIGEGQEEQNESQDGGLHKEQSDERYNEQRDGSHDKQTDERHNESGDEAYNKRCDEQCSIQYEGPRDRKTDEQYNKPDDEAYNKRCNEQCSRPYDEQYDEQCSEQSNDCENATIIPKNVTSGTHSIAQHSIAQYSKKNPLLSGSPGGETEDADKVSAEDISSQEVEIPHDKKAQNHRTGRHEWTEEEIAGMQPPGDGTKRNFDGLLYNLRQFRIPPQEQYAIILKSNFGAIGHPLWRGFYTLRDSHGKIRQPGRYLLSLCCKS